MSIYIFIIVYIRIFIYFYNCLYTYLTKLYKRLTYVYLDKVYFLFIIIILQIYSRSTSIAWLQFCYKRSAFRHFSFHFWLHFYSLWCVWFSVCSTNRLNGRGRQKLLFHAILACMCVWSINFSGCPVFTTLMPFIVLSLWWHLGKKAFAALRLYRSSGGCSAWFVYSTSLYYCLLY